MATMQEWLVFAKTEGTYGVDPTIAGTDAMLCSALQPNPINGGIVERANYRGGLYGSRPQVPVNLHQQTTFSTELTGTAEVTTPIPPPLGALLRMAGMVEALTPLSDVTYTYQPSVALHESAWLEMFNGSVRKYTLPGSRCNTVFQFQENNFPMLDLTVFGKYVIPAAAAPPAADFTGWLDPSAIGETYTTALTLDALTPEFISASFDMGNNLVAKDRPGVGENIIITDNPSTGTISLRDAGVAFANWVDIAIDQQKIMLFVLTQQGSLTTGDWRLTATARVQITGYTNGDSNEEVTEELTVALVGDASNSPITLVFDVVP